MAVFLLPSLVACSSHDDPAPSEVQETAMYLSIAPLGQTRSSVAGLPDNEKMRTVRVIVLHEDGTVEHNRHFPLTSMEYEKKLIYLKVKPDEKKKIYLFANEESVSSVEGVTLPEGSSATTLSDFFGLYPENASGFETAVNSLYFAPDYTGDKVITMSSSYEIEMGKGQIEKTFYIVRVANKFTVKFENWRDEDVNVSGLSLSRHADKNFLMAQVGSHPHSDTYTTWIDWLKDVSDKSSENDDYSVTEAAGWLTDYNLPDQADNTLTYTHQETLTVAKSTVDALNPGNIVPGKTETFFYIPESKDLNSDGEQEYTMSLRVNGPKEPLSFTLPNLKSLFRNTHVVVTVRMTTSDTAITVIVDDWYERELTLDYTETIKHGPIFWDRTTTDNYNEESRTLIIRPWEESDFGMEMMPLNGSFVITSPVGRHGLPHLYQLPEILYSVSCRQQEVRILIHKR